MNVLIPFHKGDYDQALRWMSRCKELGGAHGHNLTLLYTQEVEDHDELTALAEKCFDKVEQLQDRIGATGWPEGPNSMMQQAGWHFFARRSGPWAFLEPDTVLLVPHALDIWEKEYLESGKLFSGERVIPTDKSRPHYLSGNMICPQNVPEVAPSLVRTVLARDKKPLPFDVAAADQVLPQAHETKLIQHMDNSGKPTSDKPSLLMLREGAVIFHRDKSGAMTELLRQKRNGGDQPCPPNVNAGVPDSTNESKTRAAQSTGTSNSAPTSNPAARLIRSIFVHLTKDTMVYYEDGSVMPVKSDRVCLPSEPLPKTEEPKAVVRRRGKARFPKPKRPAEEQAKIDARMARIRAAKAKKVAA